MNSNLYYINIFKTYFPDSFRCLEGWFKPFSQYILSYFEVQNPIHRINFDWDLPGEEDIAFAFLPNAFSLNWFHAFPSQLDKCTQNSICLDDKDEELFFKEYGEFLNRVKYKSGSKQLLLKSPPNTARISSILKIYPNAKFVFIQRDHFETLASNRYMWNVVKAAQFEKVEDEQRDKLILSLEQKILAAYNEQKHLIAKDNLYELTFEKLMKSPVMEIERIFNQFSIELKNEDKLNIEKFVENKHGKHQGKYSPTSHDISILAQYPRPQIL